MFGWCGVLTALVLSCSESDSEPQTCTLIGCNNELTVELTAEEWVPGEYVVSITQAERSFDCRFEKASSSAGGQAGQSQNEAWGVAHGCAQTAGDPLESRDLPEIIGLGEAVTIRTINPTERVPVAVRRDGATLLDVELTPTYTKSYPNGKACDAASPCLNASETLMLPEEA